MPPSPPIITINLSSHPSKCPLGIILAPTKIDIHNDTHHSNNHSNPSNNNKNSSSSSKPSNLMKRMLMDHSNHNDEQFNPQNSTTIVLVGYTRHNHKMGPIQKSNLVRLGDVLVEINGVSVRNMSFRRVMDLLKCLVYGGSGNPNGENGGGMYNENHSGSSHHRAVTLNSLAFEDGRMYYYTHFDNQEVRNTFNTDALSLLSGGMIGGGNTNNNSAGGENISAMHHANKQWNMARENVLYSFSSWIQRARLRQEEEEEEEPRSSPQSPTQQSSDGVVGLNEMNMSPHVRFEEPDLQLDSSFDDITASATNKNRTHQNNEDKKKPKVYVQYEIKCVLKIKQNNQQEEETTWSIWKRYSELKKLDEHIRKTFHWSMETIKFPSSNVVRSVMYGSIHSKFVQKRKHELENYWNELCCNVDGLFDFGDPHSSHRYSYKMAEFLDLKREYFQPRMMIGSGGGIGTGAVSVTSSKPNVIQVEGAMMMDESSMSMLSNSADGGGINGGSGGVAQGGTSSAAVSLSGQLSGGGSGGVGGGGANKSTTGDMSVTSESGVLSTNGLAGGKKKKKRKKVVAKSAYQRRLMDDL